MVIFVIIGLLLFMRQYEFVTFWNIPAPLLNVWNAIEDADAWPQWWRAY
jgi:hypothetical protein